MSIHASFSSIRLYNGSSNRWVRREVSLRGAPVEFAKSVPTRLMLSEYSQPWHADVSGGKNSPWDERAASASVIEAGRKESDGTADVVQRGPRRCEVRGTLVVSFSSHTTLQHTRAASLSFIASVTWSSGGAPVSSHWRMWALQDHRVVKRKTSGVAGWVSPIAKEQTGGKRQRVLKWL